MPEKELPRTVSRPVFNTYALTVCALLTALSVVLARVLAFFPAAIVGSVLWQSMALALVYGGDAKQAFFLAKLVSRSIQFALTGTVDTLIVWLLLRRGALNAVQRRIQVKGGAEHDHQ